MPEVATADVNPGSSPGDPDPNATPASDSSPVTDVAEGVVDDRPVQNLRGEFDRKIGQLSRQVSELYNLLSSGMAVPASAAPAPPKDTTLSDEELLSLGQSGDGRALQLYIDRQIAKSARTMQTAQTAQNLVASQLTVLYSKYPVLRDSSHPLSQAAVQAKSALLGMGYPNDRGTDLEAIKLAIADNPEIVAELMGRPAAARETSRAGSASPHVATEGATFRRNPPASKTVSVSAKEQAIANRMGVKDPAKAKERFLKRNTEGRSTVSPTVANFVRDKEDV